MSLDENILNISENDQIGAFYKEECRGLAKATISPFSDKIIFQMMI